ncbi:MAG: DUF433 domain-containing protein [Chloroflexi bacterium]|nr:MAG: DUF433 domain-containing protein [Chloroflexota bacterium]
MIFAIEAQPLPLTVDQDGVVRVGKTRVTLDTIIYAFLDGATAEEIAQQYPSLSLSDIYSVLGYYLRAQDKISLYMQQRNKLAEQIKQQNEARFNPEGVRARLLARQANQPK